MTMENVVVRIISQSKGKGFKMPMEKVYDFVRGEEKARGMSDAELHYAIYDCALCVVTGVDSGYYSDEAATYRMELWRRHPHLSPEGRIAFKNARKAHMG